MEQNYSHVDISTEQSKTIAKGYERIVYGEHGPYFEIRPGRIYWDNITKVKKKAPHAYYDEAYTKTGGIKLYIQKKTVAEKPNPPPGVWSAMNDRKEGYADYKRGLVYVSVDAVGKRLPPSKRA